MKAPVTLKLCGLVVLSLLTTACTLLPLSPSLTIDVQSSEYTTSPINIPYSFETLSRNSDGSAPCSYALSRYDSTVGGYVWQSGSTDTTLQNKGTLSFPLTAIFGTTVGDPAMDGRYALTFAVLSDNYDQSGNRIPFPFLTKTVYFTVHTFSGAEIFAAKPPIVNVGSTATTVTFSGTGFDPGGTLTVSPSTILNSPATYVGPQTITASINASGGATAGTPIALTYTGTASTSSSTFYLPAVTTVGVTQISPTSGSNQNSELALVVAGSYLGFWTKVTITDASGHTAAMQIRRVEGSLSSTTYLYGTIDLTSLTAGSTYLVVTNPDGTTSQTAFTVTN